MRTRVSRRELIARVALAFGFASLGIAATAHSLAFAVRKGDIALARTLGPGDGRLIALDAQARSQLPPSPRQRAEVGRLAVDAIVRDATALPAIDALALIRLQSGDLQSGRTLFAYSMRLSRRDLPAQLWAIEDAVARNDVPRALYHYDVALRSSAPSAGVLFPVLAQAIANAPIRKALVNRLASGPLWSEAFLSYAADNGPDFIASAQLFEQLQRHGIVPPSYARAALIGRLIERRQYEAAWHFYASASPVIVRYASRNPRFDITPSDPTAFDWAALSEAGVSASVEGGALSFSASPGVGGPLARQLQMLPAGRYRLTGIVADLDQPPASRPYWSLTCVDGREVGQVKVPAASSGATRFTGDVVVPPGCPAQWLNFVAQQTDGMQGLSGTIRTVSIRPID